MIVTNDSSPHENEFLAAIAGLPEQTPSPSLDHKRQERKSKEDQIALTYA